MQETEAVKESCHNCKYVTTKVILLFKSFLHYFYLILNAILGMRLSAMIIFHLAKFPCMAHDAGLIENRLCNFYKGEHNAWDNQA